MMNSLFRKTKSQLGMTIAEMVVGSAIGLLVVSIGVVGTTKFQDRAMKKMSQTRQLGKLEEAIQGFVTPLRQAGGGGIGRKEIIRSDEKSFAPLLPGTPTIPLNASELNTFPLLPKYAVNVSHVSEETGAPTTLHTPDKWVIEVYYGQPNKAPLYLNGGVRTVKKAITDYDATGSNALRVVDSPLAFLVPASTALKAFENEGKLNRPWDKRGTFAAFVSDDNPYAFMGILRTDSVPTTSTNQYDFTSPASLVASGSPYVLNSFITGSTTAPATSTKSGILVPIQSYVLKFSTFRAITNPALLDNTGLEIDQEHCDTRTSFLNPAGTDLAICDGGRWIGGQYAGAMHHICNNTPSCRFSDYVGAPSSSLLAGFSNWTSTTLTGITGSAQGATSGPTANNRTMLTDFKPFHGVLYDVNVLARVSSASGNETYVIQWPENINKLSTPNVDVTAYTSSLPTNTYSAQKASAQSATMLHLRDGTNLAVTAVAGAGNTYLSQKAFMEHLTGMEIQISLCDKFKRQTGNPSLLFLNGNNKTVCETEPTRSSISVQFDNLNASRD